jgi:hypothetical protein
MSKFKIVVANAWLRSLRWRIAVLLVISAVIGLLFRRRIWNLYRVHESSTWIDIIVGTVILAAVPFALAAYGGHLAAEALDDAIRRRRAKRWFWGLCVAGVVLAFLQQYRSITTADTNERKTEGVETHIVNLLEDLHKPGTMSEVERRHKILQALQEKYALTHEVDQRVIDGLEPPPSDWVNAQLKALGENWNVAPSTSSTAASLPAPKPDISAAIVYPQEIALLIYNRSNAAAKDPTALIALWDLDNLEEHPNPLQIPGYSGKDGFITARGGYLVPLALAGHENVKSQLKRGDRIFGFITVGCPDCREAKAYWVYAVHGLGGWYAQSEKGKAPAMNAIARNIKDIASRTTEYLDVAVPQKRRVTIEQTVP